ncbi:lipopolysaccharide assembly protein LapB [Dyadobacter sp. CY323]|uniref:tetratricopeptide repeat protein n=1 Tax=Dyadobacter sp. CY323 TaxID=2907302 RepID=UPI001F2FB782|nr:tetratricopeptide repeat protein [Dyadobacter sp. CY323]MCE6992177.1 tetratricopeptide repeat protein [Dyadobacter sp. CY323]
MPFLPSKPILLILLAVLISCSGQDEKDAADFFLKGNKALNQKNYAEALRLYDEAISKNADFSDAYLNKGITLLKLGRPSDAYEILTEAVRIDPSLVQANLVRAEAGLDLGRLQDVRQDLSLIEKEYKDSTRYYLVEGNLYEAQGNASSALSAYDRAIALDKLNVEAYVNRGAVHYRIRDFHQARYDFENALALDPALPQALNNLGLIAIKNMDWKHANELFDKVLDKNPDDAYSLNNKGYVLLHSGEADQAKRLIERSLEKQPKNGYALRNLGLYYQRQKQYNEALKSYLKAVELADPVEELYGLTGQTYFELKDKANACKIWKQGIILKDSLAITEARRNCQ